MRKGFTLIELLVVITILGILMAMMVPAAGMIMRRAANARARADADIVVATMMKYRTEYNRWPALTAPGAAGVYLTDAAWVAIMSPNPSAPRTVDNFKQIIFFEGGGGALAADGPYAGAFVDSWGNPYKFSFDTTGSEELANPDPDPESAKGEPEIINAKVIAWSAGADRELNGMQPNEWDDNVKSWWK